MSVYKMGGPNSQSEKEISKRVASLTQALDKRTKNITKILEDALSAPGTTRAFWEGVRRALDVEYEAMYQAYKLWGGKAYPDVYQASLAQVNKEVQRMANVTNQAKKTVRQLMESRGTQTIISTLYQDALDSWASSLAAGKSNMYRLTRLTQQSVVAESLLDASVAEALQKGDLRNFPDILAGKSSTYKTLLNAAENERFIQAGSKKFTPEYYAELVSRSKFHEAQSAASTQQAINYGTDLMVVSTHNTKTEVCQAFEGKIYSISGKDKRFPPMTETSPFHPNCLHLMFPQFESALEVSGTLEDFSKFSKGKESRPPYPAGFVPLGDREGTV